MKLSNISLRTRFLIAPLIYVVLGYTLLVISSATVEQKNTILKTLKDNDLPKSGKLSEFSIQISNNTAKLTSLLIVAQLEGDEELVYNKGRVIINQLHEIEKDLLVGISDASSIPYKNSNLYESVIAAFSRYRDASISGIELSTVDAVLANKELVNAISEVEELNNLLFELSEHYTLQLTNRTELIEASLETSRSITMVASAILAIMVSAAFYFSHKMSRQIELVYQALINLSKGKSIKDLPKHSNSFVRQLTDAIYKFDKVLKERDAQKQEIQTSLSNLNAQNEHLKEAKIKAEAADKAKGEFLANMSHEIRTPLNGVIGGLQLLEKDNLASNQKHILTNAMFSANSLLFIINDILDFSKIESKKLELENKPFSVMKVLDSVEYDLLPQIKEKGIEFSIEISSDFADGRLGDPIRIKQIILNIASNAVKFTKEGAVKIKIGNITENETPAMYIRISDTGIGMTEEVQNRIFERFTQADSSTTRRYGGTGLGVAITVSLIELMEGKITLKSEHNKGTDVTITLPLKQVKLDIDNSKSAPQQTPKLKGKRLLIAEDNKVNQMIVQTMLKPTEVDYELAENGTEAVAAMKQGNFDLILMDIQMPEMDGIEAFKTIKTFDVSTPIIALTANVMSDDIKMYNELGFDGNVGKPINIQNLYSTLQKFL